MAASADQILAALAWGAVPSVGLLVGAIAGSFSRMPHQRIAMAMSVGAGLLLAGVSLKVAADAIRVAGPVAAALSLLLGAAVFSASNALLARFGAAHRKRCGECIPQPTESQQPGSGVAIALGNALDAAPEAVVLGIALRDPVVPFALVIACLRMLDADPPNVEGARETARRTIRDGNRASDVIARLRALFSKKEFTLESLDLNEATREVIALSRSELQRNRVVLHSELADDLPNVTGDRSNSSRSSSTCFATPRTRWLAYTIARGNC